MFDLEQAKKDALEFLQRTLTISELTDDEKELAEFEIARPVWEIRTEYFQPNGSVRPVKLYAAIPTDFPLLMPEMYLAEECMAEIGFVPHINAIGSICLYDATSLTLDTSRPGEVVKLAVERAIKIIEDGVAQNNTGDVTDEFVAYWSERYGPDDKHERGLNMVAGSEPAVDSLKIIVLDKKYRGFGFILHDGSEDFEIFKGFLSEAKYTFKEHPAFYLGLSGMISPPFRLSNGDISLFIEREFKSRARDFDRFLEQVFSSTYLIFSIKIGENVSFFGWHLPFVNCYRPGFRTGSLKPLRVLATFQKNYFPLRMIMEEYTTSRLQRRTAGVMAPNRYKFAFAGVGSIGSNLIPYMLSLETSQISLIDFDILTIENINRHLLGMSHVNEDKVKALKHHLQANNPLLKVDTYKSSVIEVINKRPNILNDSDFIIVSIGINNVEEYIAQALAESELTKPVLFFWVEPYLMGGHCIYLTPEHKVNFKELFKNGLYRYNMITSETYGDQDAQIKLREAGCQTSYVPYGRQSITRFLSAIMPTLYDLIDAHSTVDLAISWRNSDKVIDGLGIKLSELGNTTKEYEVQVNNL
ncbi:MAG: ThiF family adenylyltransferase [Bacteroidetes bacterium]|nr:ThiF family adenylyltransferase [Bacteroidota bacterium]